MQRELSNKKTLCMRVCVLARTNVGHAAEYMTTWIPFVLRKLLVHPPALAGSKPRWSVNRLLLLRRNSRIPVGLQAAFPRKLPDRSQTPTWTKNPFNKLATALFANRAALGQSSV